MEAQLVEETKPLKTRQGKHSRIVEKLIKKWECGSDEKHEKDELSETE